MKRFFFLGAGVAAGLAVASLPAHAAVDLYDADPKSHVVSDLTPVEGGTFQVSFQVGNKGDQNAIKASVSLYLSTDDRWQAADPVLAKDVSLPAIPARGQAAFSITLTMSQPSGPWHLIWVLEDGAESDPRDNTVVFAKTLTAEPPPQFDLSDAGTSYRSLSSREVLPGGSFDMTASVQNVGTAASGIFKINYLLSTNATLGDADDILLSARNFNSLPAGDPRLPSRVEIDRTLTIPAGTAPGTYRFGYVIEAAADSNQANNAVLFSGNFTVAAPPNSNVDLTDAGAGFWGIAPNQYVFGQQPITVMGAIRNGGTAPSGAFSLTFFASTNGTAGDADDIVLKEESFPALAPFIPGFSLRQFSVQVPTTLLTAGTYYRIGWIIIGGNDGNTANNVTLTTGSILPIPPPAIQFASDWVIGGELNNHRSAQFRFTGQLRNNGNTARTVYVKGEFRRDFGDSTAWIGPLQEGGEFLTLEAAQITLPANSTIVFDRWVGEWRFRKNNWGVWGNAMFNEWLPADFFDITLRVYDAGTDGLLASQEVAQPKRIHAASKPDLVPDDSYYQGSGEPTLFTAFSTEAIQPGGSFTISKAMIFNTGVEDAPASHARFFANDTPISAHLPVAAIERWREGSEAFGIDPDNAPYVIPDTVVTVPASVGLGEVTIYVEADSLGNIDEDAERNNRHALGTIAIGYQPDLKDEGPAHHEIPQAALPGVASTFKVRVRNFGFGAAGAFQVRAYLLGSANASPTTAPVLGTVNVNGLASLATVDTRFNFTVPSGTTHGDYHLAWKIDVGETVTEVSETNNYYVSGPVRIGPAVNLRPGSTPFALSQNQVVQGGTVQLTGSRANTGTSAAPTHRNWIVFSRDADVTTGDLVMLNSINDGTAATPAHSDFNFSHTLNIGASFQPGLYYVGYFFDTGNQVGELDETDNFVTLPEPLLVVAPIPAAGPPPAPEIIEFDRGTKGVWLRWTSRKDLEYRIFHSLNGQRWEPLLTQPGGPLSTGRYVPDDPANRFRLFRIEARRP